MSTEKLKILKASAGSGKTYSLVKEYLLLVLGGSKDDYYRHILAITFTNAAAAEMKERVLLKLHEIDNGIDQQMSREIAEKLGVTTVELAIKAGSVYRHMIHHYGLISISTIDSFTHKLIRAFSRELKLSGDFAILLDQSEFNEAVVDSFLSKIGEDPEVTQLLSTLAMDQMEEDESWKPRMTIEEGLKLLNKDTSASALEKLRSISSEKWFEWRKSWRKTCRDFENQLQEITNEFFQLIREAGITVDDFSNKKGGFPSPFIKISKGEMPVFGAYFNKALSGESEFYAKTSAKTASALFAPVKDQLRSIGQALHDLASPKRIANYHFLNHLIKNSPRWQMIPLLQRIGDDYKAENNLLLISDFHKLVHEIVKDNDAPFIYERIGNRFKHILFDEFQDTSELQWHNAIPLLENTLSENNFNLIVGDGKQSIYRWRGGKAEQFVNLPNIEIDGIHQHAGALFKAHFKEEILDTNYRSAPSIVEFNNALYDELPKHFEGANVFYKNQAQKAIKTFDGWVTGLFISGKEKEILWENILPEISLRVDQAIQDGFLPGDIAIITRKGANEGGVIANHLRSHGYEVSTPDSLLLINSPKVGMITQMIAFLIDPRNLFAITSLARFYCEFKKRDYALFIEKYTSHENKYLEVFHEKWFQDEFGIGFSTGEKTDTLSVAIQIIQYFKLSTDSFVEFLLERMREMVQRGSNSLSEWNDLWEEKKSKWSIVSAPNDQSIQIMTVHKSKGLQFPVVIFAHILPGDRNPEGWIPLGKEFELPVAYMTISSKTDGLEIDEIQQEVISNGIDKLNLIYVATTRPERRMHIAVGGISYIKTFHQAVQNTGLGEWQDDTRFSFGVRSPYSQNRPQDESVVIAHEFNGSGIPPVKKSYLEQDTPRTYGEYLHEVMAHIPHDEITEFELQNLISKTTTQEVIADRLLQDSLRILQACSNRSWFKSGQTVLNERAVIDAQGVIHRPDRVILGEEITILDYKTGQADDAHREQVLQYMRLVGEIHGRAAKGYLIYVDQAIDIVPVEL